MEAMEVTRAAAARRDALERRASAVLETMLYQIRTAVELSPVFQFWTGDRCMVMEMPDGTQGILDSGPDKDRIFRFFRRIVADRGIDACVFGTDMWAYRSTESALKLNTLERLNHLVATQPITLLVELGLFEKNAALMVLGQNASDIVQVRQYYLRTPSFRLCGPPEIDHYFQETFRGRMKMYGDCRPENLYEHQQLPAS